jgi:hypothetical protein
MPRSRPHRNRRRPGRRPPNRYLGGNAASRPGGFTPPGFDAVYRLLMPNLSGSAKRAYFNGLSDWMVVGFGLAGAILALVWLGPLGAILGLGGGLLAGGWLAGKGRFFRG